MLQAEGQLLKELAGEKDHISWVAAVCEEEGTQEGSAGPNRIYHVFLSDREPVKAV